MNFQANPDIVDDCGFSALHWATVAGNAEICQLMLDRKASVDIAAGEGAICNADDPPF